MKNIATPFSSFGMLKPNRNTQASTYRYGFNGKENDNEVKGVQGSQQDYGMRVYNPLLGKFLSRDPLSKDYPFYTPYQFAGNKPIVAIDVDGLEDVWIHIFNKDGKTYRATLVTNDDKEIAKEQRKVFAEYFGITNIDFESGLLITNEDEVDWENSVTTDFDMVTVTTDMPTDIIDDIGMTFNEADKWLNSTKGDSYGDGEDWVESMSIGGQGTASAFGYSIGVEGGLFSTEENNTGAYLNIQIEVMSTIKLPDADASLFIKANSSNEFNQNTVTNSTTMSGEGNVQLGPVGLGGSGDIPLNGDKSSGSFEIDFGKGKTGGNTTIKNTTTIQLKSETIEY